MINLISNGLVCYKCGEKIKLKETFFYDKKIKCQKCEKCKRNSSIEKITKSKFYNYYIVFKNNKIHFLFNIFLYNVSFILLIIVAFFIDMFIIKYNLLTTTFTSLFTLGVIYRSYMVKKLLNIKKPN